MEATNVVAFSWIVIIFSFAYLMTIYQIILGILTPHNCKLIPPGGTRRDVIIKGGIFLGGITLLLIIVSLVAFSLNRSQPDLVVPTSSSVLETPTETVIAQPIPKPPPAPTKSLEEQFNEQMAALHAKEAEEARAAALAEAAQKARAVQRREVDATAQCKDFVKTSANYPSTVKIPFLGVETLTLSSGQVRVFINFTAENAFGNRLKFRATCQFMEGAVPNFVIESR